MLYFLTKYHYLQGKVFSYIIKMVIKMYTIKEALEYELIIKNSKFIALIHQVKKKEEIEKYLNLAKKKYPKATHYVYAYKISNIEKSNDDGEPSGTAGMPILNVLKAKEITNVLVIVIRYFGGIKLGAGGLIRAYASSCKKVLEKAHLVSLIPAKKVKIITTYANQKNSKILEKNFTDKIIYIVLIEDEHILDNKFAYEVIGDDYIETC